MQKICVIGLGYIGLPTAAMFATHGFQVVGMDIDDHVVDILRNGEVHIQEPGLKTLVKAAINSGNLQVTNLPESADVFIIAVPTPLSTDHEPLPRARSVAVSQNPVADLSYVIEAAKGIVPYLRPGNLVVLESTVPPRTTEDVLLPILEESNLRVGVHMGISDGGGNNHQANNTPAWSGLSDGDPSGNNQLYIAHCPERVLPGHILEELVGNDRVIGGVSRDSALLAEGLYCSFVEGEILITDATTAEMVKLMENTYRDVNIALANELALVAEQVGTSVWESIELANRHPRVQILTPGPGVGGHCIAVDPWFIAQAAPDLTQLIQTARQVNDDMPQHVVDLVKKALAKLPDEAKGYSENRSKILVACLGLAYKGDVDDVRESPAIKVLNLLKKEGFEIRAYDGFVKIGAVPEQVNSLEAAVNDADVMIVLTDHTEFRGLKPDKIPGFKGKVIIDTRHTLPTKDWAGAERIFWRTGSMETKHKF